MTTDHCISRDDSLVNPPGDAADLQTPVQDTAWTETLFTWIGSVSHASLSAVEALLRAVPWSGWAFLALGLLVVLTRVRPRTTNVTNHYHRRSRRQFKPKR